MKRLIIVTMLSLISLSAIAEGGLYRTPDHSGNVEMDAVLARQDTKPDAKAVSAQSVEGLEYVIDVNGLVPHTIVSHIKIVGALGQPDRIETREGMDGDEVWYFYGDNYFGFRNEGEFFDFYVKDPRFKV